MDRRKIVYYNRNTSYRPAARKQKSSIPKIPLRRSVFVLLAIITITGFIKLNKPNSDNNDTRVLAEQTTSPETDQTTTIDSPLQKIKLPKIGQSAIGTLDQGVIKQTKNEKQAPIASITKVVTALVILDKRPLKIGEAGDTILLSERDLQYFDEYYAKLGTVTTVTPGESMTQYEALQAILLPSSNNMSDTLVDRYFANMNEYTAFANDYLAKNGLTNTVIADASGFSPESKSTPSDLIKLGQLALKNPVIAEIVAQPTATLSVAGDVPNYNALINEPDVIGIKPGSTDEAGYCLLFAANLPDKEGKKHTMIAVTMGHPERPEYVESAKKLLDDAREYLIE